MKYSIKRIAFVWRWKVDRGPRGWALNKASAKQAALAAITARREPPVRPAPVREPAPPLQTTVSRPMSGKVAR